MKERLYLFDNLKALLMFLVVFGHFFGKIRKEFEIIHTIYTFIYAFHMPVFLFVSGYFAKYSIKDNKYKKPKIINYFIIYLIVQLLFCMFFENDISIFCPKNALWYIQILILAHLCLPYISMLKPKAVLLISIILGLLAGIETTTFFSISRFLVFMPFFLLGYYFDINKIKRFFKTKYVVLSSIFILTFILLIQFSGINKEFLIELYYGKVSYIDLGINSLPLAMLIRTIYYIITLVLTITMLIVIPKKKNKLSYIGERTLQIYLLHIPFYCVFWGKENFITKGYNFTNCVNTPIEAIILAFLVIILVFILSSKMFSKPFDVIMKKDFMLKEKN